MAGLTSLGPLNGRWILTRRILHADGTENRFEGIATFTPSGRQMTCDEEGLLSGLPGTGAIRATRRYIWIEGNGQIEVLFHDMRPFHMIPLGEARPGTTYDCPPDTYDVSYDFTDLSCWRATWRVEGPKKSYVMESEFRKEPKPFGPA